MVSRLLQCEIANQLIGDMIDSYFELKKRPMTVIVAIQATDSILLAADSQTTDGNRKRTDAEKISIVQIGEVDVLAAESGMDNLSGRALEFVKNPTQPHQPTAAQDIVDAFERAIRQALAVLRETMGPNSAPEAFAEYVEKRADFALTIAFYWNKQPYVYNVRSTRLPPRAMKGKFDAYGSGGELGYYVLKECCQAYPDFWRGFVTAIYAVEKVKENDCFCSGPTRVGVIRKETGKAQLLRDDDIGDIVKSIRKYDDSTATKQAEVVKQMLTEAIPSIESRDAIYRGMGWIN